MTLETRLKIFGAKRADIEASKSLVVSVEGEDKAGKSRFWMTAPAPILAIDLDQRMNDTIQEFQKEKEIYVIQPEIDRASLIKAKMVSMNERAKGPTTIKDQAWLTQIKKAWNDTVDAIEAAGKEGVRTVAVDTADEWWELCRLANFGGRLDKIQPMEYGPVNLEYAKPIKIARKLGMNVILAHKIKAEYKPVPSDKKKSYATGEMIRAGYAQTGGLCDLSLRLWQDKKTNDFYAKVLKCGFKPDQWVGEEFSWNEELDIDEVEFPFIAAAVMSGEEDQDDARLEAVLTREEWA